MIFWLCKFPSLSIDILIHYFCLNRIFTHKPIFMQRQLVIIDCLLNELVPIFVPPIHCIGVFCNVLSFQTVMQDGISTKDWSRQVSMRFFWRQGVCCQANKEYFIYCLTIISNLRLIIHLISYSFLFLRRNCLYIQGFCTVAADSTVEEL